MLSADNLHNQALALHRQRGRGRTIYLRPHQPPLIWDETNRATFLLCAFAIESAIKGFLVYEHPDWIAGGYLHNEICSHKLVELSERSSLIPYRNRDRWVLAAFEDGHESWMRYPCGRRADDVQLEPQMHDRLWAGYVHVLRGYGVKLVRLLGEGWNSPYGDFGYWTMDGEWLGNPHGGSKATVMRA